MRALFCTLLLAALAVPCVWAAADAAEDRTARPAQDKQESAKDSQDKSKEKAKRKRPQLPPT